jgi:hypothetical protein
MKKIIPVKLILIPVILATVWMGGQLVQDVPAQTPALQSSEADFSSTAPDNAPATGSLPTDVDPDSPLAQVIRLVQASVEQSVVLTYISNSTNLFNLNAEEIIYLNDLGAPPEIANAMMQHDQQLQQAGTTPNSSEAPPPATTEPPAAPPTEASVNYFYNTLAPYGGWVNLDGYGWCWRPTIVVYSNGWQPYCNNGYWVYSNCGWYWVSGYSWGWATFHYGRWFNHPHYGWCWWPDTTWAPSWVCWRYNQDYCGWAPLPPHAVYHSGVGFFYQGHAVSVGFNFGLTAGAFTFVPTKNFCDPHPQHYRVNATEVTRVYNQTTVINNISFDNHQHGIINAGIPPQHITGVTRQVIHPVTIQAGNGNPAWGGKHEQFAHNGTTLIVNRPQFVGTPVLTVHPGTPPGAKPGQNQSQPVVYGNGTYTTPHPVTPGQNNPPHQNINQNPYQNYNQPRPRVPQGQPPQVTQVAPSTPQANYKSTTEPPQYHQPWPVQNQTPDQHYNSDNRFQSPRESTSEPPSRSGATYDPPPQGNAAAGQPHSDPSANNHYSPPPDGSHNNNQSANHSGATQPNAQPHPTQSSSSSSGNQNQNQGNGQNGH